MKHFLPQTKSPNWDTTFKKKKQMEEVWHTTEYKQQTLTQRKTSNGCIELPENKRCNGYGKSLHINNYTKC